MATRDLMPHRNAQLRNATAFSVDIVNSTHYAATMPVRELRNLLLGYYQLCQREIERHHGQVIRYIGDGVLALFDTSEPADVDQLNAIMCGLTILSSGYDFCGRPVRLRVTAATGDVLIDDAPRENGRQVPVFGEVFTIVARMKDLTPVDSMVMDGSILKRASGLCQCEKLGKHALKGFKHPFELVEVQSINHSNGARRKQNTDYDGRLFEPELRDYAVMI